MAWDCFVITGTDRARRRLRRYAAYQDGTPCQHDASTPIEDGTLIVNPDGSYRAVGNGDWPRDDPRWPTACACGYQFTDDDAWQLFFDRIYVDAAGNEYTLRDAPIGAMWRCEWFEDAPAWAGPDGESWSVCVPPGGLSGHWCVDGPSSSGGSWTRTGTPPRITAHPSIHVVGTYHGWLVDGVLSDDIDGRRFDEGAA